MIPRIKSIVIKDEYKLLINFTNNKQKLYNVSRLFTIDEFKPLMNPVLFQQAKVDAGGYGISWNDDIDISEHEAWSNSFEIQGNY